MSVELSQQKRQVENKNTAIQSWSLSQKSKYNVSASGRQSLNKKTKKNEDKSVLKNEAAGKVVGKRNNKKSSLETYTDQGSTAMQDLVGNSETDKNREKNLTVKDANEAQKKAVINDKKDSVQTKALVRDSLQHFDSSATMASTKMIVIRHKDFFVDAGVQLRQQVPFGKQKLTAYNYNGNRNIWLDYVPSVYLKLEKNKQWFLQGEFSYISSYAINDFIYSQKTKPDYSHVSVAVTTNRFKKLFYSEVPVHFNYYLHSNWSIGAGAVYSQLRGAVAEKETVTRNILSGAQTIAKQTMPVNGYTDSFLYKTKMSLLLQTNYTKERWTFGLRYLHDLQPFVRYTLPDGKINDKTNASLLLMIRYRIFRSSKFEIIKKASGKK